MLAISRYVIHEVHKDFNVKGATIDPSLNIAFVDDFAKKLVSDSHISFADSTSLKNTQFETGHSTVFHTGLTNYFSDETDEKFYNFTINSLGDLKTKIENEQFAVGGYYLFADYHYDGRRFISAVLLRKKSGVNFQKIRGIYLPVDGENINIDKIAMGFRLNHGIFISDDADKNYIALVTNQKEKLSGYFKSWVQAAGIISNDKNTTSFVRIINSIDMPIADDGTPKYENREEMKKAYYDMIEQSPGKSINLPHLSQHFYGEENKSYILNFAQNNQIIIDPEFKRSSQILKKLITIRAKVAGIEITVNYDKLNVNEVDVLEDRIIIRSQALVDQINQQKNEQ
jgi:nucleoid-associated protein YejK